MALDGNEYTRIAVGGPGIAYGVITDKVEAAVLAGPGIGYTLDVNRLHYTMPEEDMHYTLDINKIHYTVGGDDES